MQRNKLIIVEGAQGAGKTTITRLLREQVICTSLLSMAGLKNCEKGGEIKSYANHYAVLSMIDNCKDIGMNFVLDRSFLTERVYCALGYKDFSFCCQFDSLLDYLDHIADSYDTYIIVLKASKDEFEKRLERDKPQYMNLQFKARNSVAQQKMYIELLNKVRRSCNNIECIEIDTDGRDPYDIVYDIKEGILMEL